MKVSTFIVAILVVSLCVTGFVSYYVGMSASYGSAYTDQISGLDQYNATYNNISANINNQIVSNQSPATGGFNTIGDFLSTGYNSIRYTFQSIGIFYNMLDTGFSNIPLGDSVETPTLMQFKLIIASIVFILFITIVISILVNRQDL